MWVKEGVPYSLVKEMWLRKSLLLSPLLFSLCISSLVDFLDGALFLECIT